MRWRRLLQEAIPVRQGERSLTFLLFLQCFCAVGTFVTGRSARDAMLLGDGRAAQLPWLILGAALGVSLMGLAYAPLSSRVRRDRLAVGGAVLSAIVYASAWLAERAAGAWMVSALYVGVEILGALALLQFWTLVNELYDARSARRLYGLIGAGGTAANILIGLAVAMVARAFGAEALLLLCAILSVGMAVAALLSGRAGRQRLFARAASGRVWGAPRAGGVRQALSHPHLRTIALLAGVTFFTTTLIDYEFKVIAGASLERDALAAFFGHLSIGVGVLGITMQVFATGRLLRVAGVIGALAVLPASLGLGGLALALFPSLWAATAAKGADALFRYSVNDASTQILYLPVPPHDRAASKALIDGVVKPVAIAGAGLALALWQRFGGGMAPLAWAGVVLCLLWLTIVLGLHSQYVRVLQQNLTRPRADLEALGASLVDAAGRDVLGRALQSEDSREVLNALELLPAVGSVELDGRVELLLSHRDAGVRVAAIGYFAKRQQVRVANALFRAFDDPDPAVRAAAVDAFCCLGRDRAVRSVQGFLQDPDPGVRGAAITGLIRWGGLDGVVMAAGALKALIAHEEPDMRARAASVLGAIGIQNFYQPVLELMADPAPEVRRRAVQAAGLLKGPEFILPLIYRAGSADAGAEAVVSLAAYGTSVLPTLGKVLANELEELPVRRAVARVLGRIPAKETVNLIVRHLDAADEELRVRLYRSLARLMRSHQLSLGDPAPVRAMLHRELQRAWEALQAAEILGLEDRPLTAQGMDAALAEHRLLGSALREKIERIEQRAFVLLAVLFPEAGMEHIVAGLRRGADGEQQRRRANAVELLDNLLDRPLKRILLPLLDEAPREVKLAAVVGQVPFQARDPASALRRLQVDENAWVRACALWLTSRLRPELLEELLPSATADANPVVRETALAAAGQRLAPERVRGYALELIADLSPAVSKRARALLDQTQRSVA